MAIHPKNYDSIYIRKPVTSLKKVAIRKKFKGGKMAEEIYRKSDIKKLRKVRELTPESFKAYVEFDKQALADGALPKKKQNILWQ